MDRPQWAIPSCRYLPEGWRRPAPGHLIHYPVGISETEILIAYGGVDFSSKVGRLAGNHFVTITSDLDKLSELGRRTL